MNGESKNVQHKRNIQMATTGGLVNNRSINGNAKSNQFSFNGIKSSTPKNQNIPGGFTASNYRTQNGLQGFNNGQRNSHATKNMTQVINLKDHLPQDLRAGAN